MEVRRPGNFTRIETFDKIEIHLYQGNECKIEVNAGKNLIKSIETSVANGVLTISNNNRCNFMRGYKRTVRVNITLPYLKKINNAGVAGVWFEDEFVQDTLRVWIENSGDTHVKGHFNYLQTSSNGNGDMYLSGSCDSLYIFTMGSNFVRAEELIVSSYALVHTFTLGDCFINAEKLKRFDYYIEGVGNIFYKGLPYTIYSLGDGSAKGRAIRQD
jgi:hypothetical protein